MTPERLEEIKQIYHRKGWEVPRELVAEVERLQAENTQLKIEIEELETIVDIVKQNDLIRQLVLGEVDSQIENLLTLRGIEEVL